MNFVKKGEYAICNIDLGERTPLVREGGADAIRRHSGREMKGRITDWHGMMKGCCHLWSETNNVDGVDRNRREKQPH